MSTVNLCFFSHKGGSGRSLALANCAYELAKRGYKVACIDMDLDAPGLQEIFGLPEESCGDLFLLDLLNDPSYTNMNRTVVDLKDKLGFDIEGELYLFPARRENVARLKKLSIRHEDWPSVFAEFRENVINPFVGTKRIDFLLVDCRSGMSQETLVPLIERDNTKAVILFRLDRQSRAGTKYMAHELGKAFEAPDIFLVANALPPQKALVNPIISDFETLIDAKLSAQIPMDPETMLNESITVLTKPIADISVAYKKLVDALVENLGDKE